jgi:hypothetical protein
MSPMLLGTAVPRAQVVTLQCRLRIISKAKIGATAGGIWNANLLTSDHTLLSMCRASSAESL